jgi:drug/metabolite transporter (DMT)-like permease
VTGWSALAWSIVIPVYVAWTLWSWASTRTGVARISIFMYLVPMVSGLASWWFLAAALIFLNGAHQL